METAASASAVRRLARLSSHFRPHSSSSSSSPQLVVAPTCSRNCIFCRIVRGESPSLKVYEDDVCLCILDANPLCRGHSLIIPKCHYTSLQETPPSVVGAMCSKVPLISRAVMKATGCDSFNLLVNNGVAAGQVIFHSLSRRQLKLDQEAVKLADSIRVNLPVLNNLEDSKGQGSSLIEN